MGLVRRGSRTGIPRFRPVLNSGCMPPMGEGFPRFLAAPTIAPQVEANVQKELKEGRAAPTTLTRHYASGSPRLSSCRRPEKPEDTRLASSLLVSPESVEINFLSNANPDLPADKLAQRCWDAVPSEVTVPAWRTAVEESGLPSKESPWSHLPMRFRDCVILGASLPDPKGMLLTPEQRIQRAGRVLSCWLGSCDA